MQLNRNQLVGTIKNLRPGIAGKEIIEQSTHIIFYGDCVCAYNDEIFASMPLKTGIKGTVDADLLLKIVSKYEEEEIKLEVSPDKKFLDIFGDINSAKLPLVLESPIFQHIDEVMKEYNSTKSWKKLPTDFQVGLEMCSFSASRDRTLGAMCCLRIEGGDILSTDKYRIGWYVLEMTMGNFLLEADHAMEISKYKALTQYHISNSWAHFKSDNDMILSCRIVQPPDEITDLRPFFALTEDIVRLKLPSDLIKRAELAGVLSEGTTIFERQIELRFDNDEVVCCAKSERGTIEGRSKLEKPIPFPITIQISPDLLIEILKFVSSTVIIQKIDDDRGKVIFRSRGFSHCMVVRLGK